MNDWLMDRFPAFAERLSRYRCKGDDKGQGSCPCSTRHRHKDRHFSLLFQKAQNGGLIFRCFAGCSKREILAAMGLTWKDVCVDKPEFRGPNSNGYPDNQKLASLPRSKLVKVYDYRRPVQEGSTVEFQALRYFPKRFTVRRPMPGHPDEYAYRIHEGHVVRVPSKDPEADPTGFKWVESRDLRNGEPGSIHLPAVRPTLYCTDVITMIQPEDKIVLFCGGEKDADAAMSHGFLATTVQGGECNRMWCREWSSLVKGRIVIFLPDNDQTGVEYAAWYAGCCQIAGAAGTAIVRLPGLKEKGDLSDWLFANRFPQKDPLAKKKLTDKLKGIIAQADLYAPRKLYSVFGYDENPFAKHGNPQPLPIPKSATAPQPQESP